MSSHVATYTIDPNDRKSMIRVVRDDLKRVISSPGAVNVERAKRKIRFYDWLLEQEDGWQRFTRYCDLKRLKGEELGFLAAGWTGK